MIQLLYHASAIGYFFFVYWKYILKNEISKLTVYHIF
eukprot:UN15451